MALNARYLSTLVRALRESLWVRFAGIFCTVGMKTSLDAASDLPFGDPVYLTASVMDPAFCLMWLEQDVLVSEDEKADLLKHIKDSMLTQASEAPTMPPETGATAAAAASSEEKDAPPPKFSRLFSGYKRGRHKSDGASSSATQYNRYLELAAEFDDARGPNGCLQFWLANKGVLAKLFPLAMRSLCVPASSSPIERVFSHGGIIMRPHRARLSDKIFAMVSLIFVMLSICAFCMETAKPFQVVHKHNTTDGRQVTYTEPVPFLFAVEGVCVAFFTIELIARFVFCPNKCRFCLTVETIIDIVACIPFYVDAMKKIMGNNTPAGTDILSFLRIVRVFRIFKLARHLSGLQVLMHTLRASAKELLLLIVFMALGVLITSSLVYYAERWAAQEGAKNDFENIPVGFWWAIVTMTTVGYGDLVPRTWLGMIVGAVTAVIGVLTLALPVPVIVNNFALYYTHAQAREKLPKKRKRALVGAADALKTQSAQFVSSSISGYSSQSTNEDGDDVSIRSEDVKTVSGQLPAHRTHNSVAPLSASGVKTEITVTYTDEETSDPTPSAPGSLLSPTQSDNTASTTASSHGGTHRRHTAKRHSTAAVSRKDSLRPNGTTRRESFVPNGVKGRARQAQTRRQSMMPTMPEEDSDDDYYIADF